MSKKKQTQELLDLFRTEATEYLDGMNRILLTIETEPDLEAEELKKHVQELFRMAHSLKGAARTVNWVHVEKVAHTVENTFAAMREEQLQLTPDIADTIYDGLDAIQVLLSGETENLDLDGVLSNIASLAPVEEKTLETAITSRETQEILRTQEMANEPPLTAGEVIRVPVSKLDELMIEASNLLVSRMNIEQRLGELRQLNLENRQWQRQWRAIHTQYLQLIRFAQSDNTWQPMADFLQQTQRYMKVSAERIQSLETSLHDDSVTLGLNTDALQEQVRSVRLLPFDTIANGLRRLVRDLARDLDKDVMFQIIGGQIELDKQVIERIRDPLVHILRNAVDHGLESVSVRSSLGKPEQGLILVALIQRGSTVHIMITDDGRGIDAEQVSQKAVRLGLITEAEASLMTQMEIYELLLLPGMSTRDTVSEISGRGVGLDIVRQAIESMQGQMSIRSQAGQGSTFEIILPISLSTLNCVLVSIGQETYAIPTTAVVRVVDYQADETFTVRGQTMLRLDEQVVPLAPLSDALERPSGPEQLVVVIASSDRAFGFLVADVLAEQEVVVRNLNPEFARVRNVNGATLMANGEVVIILNVNDLIKSAQGRTVKRRSVEVPPERPSRSTRILVVDDSITTRTLQKNILEASGYVVEIATHGLEALDKLNAHEIDLMITDIEMPWMDGFELTSRVRNHPSFRNLPVILVTSLDSAENREAGFQVGADAYIVKGVFDQKELLETIRTLL